MVANASWTIKLPLIQLLHIATDDSDMPIRVKK